MSKTEEDKLREWITTVVSIIGNANHRNEPNEGTLGALNIMRARAIELGYVESGIKWDATPDVPERPQPLSVAWLRAIADDAIAATNYEPHPDRYVIFQNTFTPRVVRELCDALFEQMKKRRGGG